MFPKKMCVEHMYEFFKIHVVPQETCEANLDQVAQNLIIFFKKVIHLGEAKRRTLLEEPLTLFYFNIFLQSNIFFI